LRYSSLKFAISIHLCGDGGGERTEKAKYSVSLKMDLLLSF
jgi:hypothetical protein